MNGIDVSADQYTISWERAAASVHFAYAKATEGITYSDATFRQNHDGAKAHGVAFGAYHFVRFLDDPVAQAQHFCSTIDGYMGTLAPMLDVEVSDGAQGLTDKLAALQAEVQRLCGKQPIIYTSYGFWNDAMAGTDAFSGRRLWVAEYNSQSAPSLPNGWSKWVIWQHTSSAVVAGVPTRVDLDLLNGEDISILE